MRSLRNLRAFPAGLPLLPEDLVEFHAARLLLLVNLCGVRGRIDGLTKLAKLDFFVRYPAFFARACVERREEPPTVSPSVESTMIRHHYGPWDHRYYHVLAYLEGKELLRVSREGARSFRFQLTDTGQQVATQLAASPAFQELVSLMGRVKKVLGRDSGNILRDLVYRLFEKEVAFRKRGEVIPP